MAATEGITGIHTTVAHSTTQNGTYTPLAEVFDVNSPEMSVAIVEFTHYNSDDDQIEKKPSGWKDIGDVTLSMNFTSAQYDTLVGLVGDEDQWFQITVGDSGAVHEFRGFVSKLGGSPVAIKDRVVEKVTITVSGDYDFTAGT